MDNTELLDNLRNNLVGETRFDAAARIEQQAARIAELEAEVERLKDMLTASADRELDEEYASMVRTSRVAQLVDAADVHHPPDAGSNPVAGCPGHLLRIAELESQLAAWQQHVLASDQAAAEARAQLQRTSDAWTAMNELQAKEYRRANAAEAERDAARSALHEAMALLKEGVELVRFAGGPTLAEREKK
jgi:hypothetical protein